MANYLTLPLSLHLLLSTSFCLHVSLEWNINIIHDISRVKYNAFRKFPAQNILATKCNDKNFLHKLFEIEINTNENKANYSMSLQKVHHVFAHYYNKYSKQTNTPVCNCSYP